MDLFTEVYFYTRCHKLKLLKDCSTLPTWVLWISPKDSWPSTLYLATSVWVIRQMPWSKKLDRIYDLEHPLATCISEFQNMAPLCTSAVTFHGARFAGSKVEFIWVCSETAIHCSCITKCWLQIKLSSPSPTKDNHGRTARSYAETHSKHLHKSEMLKLLPLGFSIAQIDYVSYGVSISLSHLLVKILVHNLSLVKFETGGLEIPMQFAKKCEKHFGGGVWTACIPPQSWIHVASGCVTTGLFCIFLHSREKGAVQH